VPALPSSVLEPLWVQVAALLPARQVHHPLGCHRRRIPDRIVFGKLVWGQSLPQPTAGMTGCWQRPWTPWPCSMSCPPGRWCTWTPAMTTSPAGRSCMSGAWLVRSPREACRHRSRPPAAGRWSAPTPGATSTASCAGALSAAGWWPSSGWRWPTPPSCLADWSVAPGPAIGGTPAHDDGHNTLLALAQASASRPLIGTTCLRVGVRGYWMTTRYSAGWARTLMPLMRCWNSGEAAALRKWSADSHSATLT
jgi:hypothetical protein